MSIIDPSGQPIEPIKRNGHHPERPPKPSEIKPDQRCCFNCEHARSVVEPGSSPVEGDKEANRVICRRYPPSVIAMPQKMQNQITGEVAIVPQAQNVSPGMECELYCGEFKMRGGEA